MKRQDGSPPGLTPRTRLILAVLFGLALLVIAWGLALLSVAIASRAPAFRDALGPLWGVL